MKSTKILGLLVGCLAPVMVSSAQQVISAKSGLVNYVQGDVRLDGKPVEVKIGNFPTVGRQSELRTEEGRAEVLLGPGVFLRLGENSAFKMTSDRLSDTRVDFVAGSMIVQAADLTKDESVAITHNGAIINLTKNGVYRMDSDPARIMVYDGEARVEQNGQSQVVKRSKQLMLNGVSVAEKFDNKTGDALYRWARRRDGDLAVANISAARSVGRYGNSYYGGYGSSFGSTGWFFNPFFGTYTYLPMGGFYDSFWGYRYWSPVTVYSYYVPPVIPRGGGGGTNAGTVATTAHHTYTTAPATSTGTSGSAARSAPPMVGSSAGRVSVPRDSSAGRVGGMSGPSMSAPPSSGPRGR